MSLRILYVEDDRDLRETVELLLQFSGRAVAGCGCAETAWDAIETQAPFDVVVTDLTLPKASGLDLARRVLARNPQQWLVLCSGASASVDPATLGRNVLELKKPFAIEHLEAVLDHIRDRTSASAALSAAAAG